MNFSQEGVTLSLGLHLSILGVAIAWMWAKPFQREHEPIFEVVQIPLGSPDAPRDAAEAPPAFEIPSAPPVRPLLPPPPQRQAEPPPPQPQRLLPPPPIPRQTVAPPPPRTTPPQQPQPEPARQMTYEEFVREHGQPQTRAPRQTSTRPTPPRTAPRLDTRFTVDLSDAIRSPGSLSGSSDAARTAVNIYVAGLNDLLKQAWNNPQLALTTVVEFDVSSAGRISNVRITSKSGNAAFDESVLAAFRQVTSGGPTPDGRPLELRFKFNGVNP